MMCIVINKMIVKGYIVTRKCMCCGIQFDKPRLWNTNYDVAVCYDDLVIYVRYIDCL